MVDYLLILDEFIEVEKPTEPLFATYVTPYALLTKTTRFGL